MERNKTLVAVMLSVILTIFMIHSGLALDENGLVLHYDFQENNYTGATGEVKDLSAFHNDGTTYGGVSLAGSGVDGRSASFSRNYMITPHSNSLDLTSEFSISTWVYMKSLPAGGKYPNILGKLSDYTGYGLYYNGDTRGIEGIIGNWNHYGTWYTTPKYSINTNEWHYIVTTYDGNTYSLYADGVLVGSTDSVPNPSSNPYPIIFARHYSNPGGYGYLDSMIDEAVVYNRSLSGSEILDIYDDQRVRISSSVINGVCGTAFSSCTLGTYSDLPDEPDYSVWQCLGIDGGSNSICKIPPVSGKYNFTVTVTGNGTVLSYPFGIYCGNGNKLCSYLYKKGTLIYLYPKPSLGYNFTSWSGACSGNSSCIVNLTSSKTVGALFTKPNTNPSLEKVKSAPLYYD